MKALRVSARHPGGHGDRRRFDPRLQRPAVRQAARRSPPPASSCRRCAARRTSWSPRSWWRAAARGCGTTTRDRRGSPCGRSPTPSSTPIWRAPARRCCASVGAYQLEGLGAHLFSRVDGDYFTILGLPLLPLLSFLAGHGIGLETDGMSPYETLLRRSARPAVRRHRRLAGRAFALAGAARLLAEAARHRRPLRPPAGRAQSRGAGGAGRLPQAHAQCARLQSHFAAQDRHHAAARPHRSRWPSASAR